MTALPLLLAACAGRPLEQEQLLDPEACASCHPDQYAEWRGSMHAYAAVDPIFRAMNARGQRETGGELGDFCVDCHAPMAVRLGATEDGLNLDEVDPKLLGVTCYTCHAVTEVTDDHNNALVYADDGILRGGIVDPIDTPAHASAHGRYQDRQYLDSARMCGSCHDVVTPAGVKLERTYLEWSQAQYAQATSGLQQTCGNCHMDGRDAPAADVDGAPLRRVHSHAFPAVDTALVEFPDREQQAELVQDALDPVVLPQLQVCTGTEGAQISLRLENVAAGHGFPSGAAQDRRAWVEVRAWRAGEVVFESGVVPAGTALSEVDDPTRWWLGDQMLDAEGHPVHLFWEATSYTSSQLQGLTEGVNVHQTRTWVLGTVYPDRVEARIFLRPIDFDVLDELVESGDLDPAIAEAMPTWELRNGAQTWEGLVDVCP